MTQQDFLKAWAEEAKAAVGAKKWEPCWTYGKWLRKKR